MVGRQHNSLCTIYIVRDSFAWWNFMVQFYKRSTLSLSCAMENTARSCQCAQRWFRIASEEFLEVASINEPKTKRFRVRILTGSTQIFTKKAEVLMLCSLVNLSMSLQRKWSGKSTTLDWCWRWTRFPLMKDGTGPTVYLQLSRCIPSVKGRGTPSLECRLC